MANAINGEVAESEGQENTVEEMEEGKVAPEPFHF